MLQKPVLAAVELFRVRSGTGELRFGHERHQRQRCDGDDPSDYFLSAALSGNYHFFLYNYPKTDISVALSVLPGITDWPRVRVNFNGSLKREIITDFTVNFSIFDSYDSKPAGGTEAANHDFGIILSVGWTF